MLSGDGDREDSLRLCVCAYVDFSFVVDVRI